VKEAAVDTKTRNIDFEALSLKDAVDLAMLVEQEAKERYSELFDQMVLHHNPEVAAFFKRMFHVEVAHENHLTERRRELFADAPVTVRREMLFDIEAPDYDEVRQDMTARDALHVALRAEQKAFAFFDAALAQVKDASVRELFANLRYEERQHQAFVEAEIARLPLDEGVNGAAFEDEPVAH
jgi:rubrerythrin